MVSVLRKVFSCRNMVRPEKILGEVPASRQIYQNTFHIAWPSAVESVMIGLISIIDTIMVGTIGSSAIAAVGLTTQPRFLILAWIFSLDIGVTAIVARRKGQGNYRGANDCLRQSILLSIMISLTLSVLAYIYATPLVTFAGAGPDVLEDAVAYFKIILLGIVPTSVSITINAAQRGAGNTKISMRTNLAANLVNVVFNYLLIGGHFGFPRLGVRGAAIATALGYLVAFFMSVKSVVYSHGFLNITRKDSWRFDKNTLQTLFRVSSNALVEQLFVRIGFFSFSKIVANLGTVAFATHQVSMNLLNLSFCFGDGFSTAAAALVGQNLGAKRPDMAEIYCKATERITFVASLLIAAVLILFRTEIVTLFTREREVVLTGAKLMIMTAIISFPQNLQCVIGGCLRGAGDTRFVAVSSFISITLVRPILGYLLTYSLGFGLIGAWTSMLLDHISRAAINYGRFKGGKWTKIEV